MFNFTSLLGAQSSSTASQSVLEFDGRTKILVNIGWDAGFDIEKLKELERHAPTISCILLTHATTAHLGAFAHCCKHFPQFSRIPVFATEAVVSLGTSLLQDIYASTPLACTTIPKAILEEVAFSSTATHNDTETKILLQRPTSSEIAEYFARVEILKYSQPREITSSPSGVLTHPVSITAYNAGYSFGGTIWHIKNRSESVVYAEDWNQYGQLDLAGAAWLDTLGEVTDGLRKPTALISGCRGSSQDFGEGGIAVREAAMVRSVKNSVSNNGTLILPTESTTHLLELVLVFNKHFQDLHEVSACIATSSCISTLQFARNVLHLDFNLENFALIETKSSLDEWLAGPGPKVLLASDFTLEWGFAREALLNLASDTQTTILLTKPLDDSQRFSLQNHLWQLFQQGSSKANPAMIKVVSAEPLGDHDQPLYQAYLARQRQIQQGPVRARALNLETTAVPGDEESWASSSEDSDEETGQQGKALMASQMLQKYTKRAAKEEEDEGVNVLLKGKDVFDWDITDKSGKNTRLPFRKRQRTKDTFDDEYGDSIDHGLFAKVNQQSSEVVERPAKQAEGHDKTSQIDEKDDFGRDSALRAASNPNFSTNGNLKAEPESTGPQKLIVTDQEFEFKVHIDYVDFSSHHDRPSIRMLFPKIRPAKVILIGGSQEETLKLATECKSILDKNVEILAPITGETVDGSSDTSARDVKISEKLYRSLQWHNVRKGLRVAKIAGEVQTDAGSGLPILTKSESTGQVAAKPQTLMIGDVRLADLRRTLEALGYPAEYRGEGTLVIGGHVLIRKRPGRIEIEGTALAGAPGGMQTFLNVKHKVYDSLAIL